jgi:two-component system sensor histidine kinase CiaH
VKPPTRPSKRLAFTRYAYWFLLSYLLAALAWWFIELWKQNDEMFAFKSAQLDSRHPAYRERLGLIRDERERNRAQYIGEGAIFLVLTVIGAVYVYRSVRREMRINESHKNFMMAVTHELKTPIAITRLNLETLNRHRLDEEKKRSLVDRTLQETSRLNDLCNNILLSSQLDAGGYKMSEEELDLSGLLSEVVDDFRSRFPSRSIGADIPSGTDIRGDRLLLVLAFNNLVENAIRYTPKEGSVRLTLEPSKDSAEIRVLDEGPGIPKEEKPRVFERFYRMGSEANRRTKGTGLGLYLTRRIVADHGGTIWVEDNEPVGSTFVVQLPNKSS